MGLLGKFKRSKKRVEEINAVSADDNACDSTAGQPNPTNVKTVKTVSDSSKTVSTKSSIQTRADGSTVLSPETGGSPPNRADIDSFHQEVLPSGTSVQTSVSQGPVTASPEMPTASKGSQSSKSRTDNWAQAYQVLRVREPDLTKDYNKHLDALYGGNAATDLSDPDSIKSVIKKLQENRERKQWQVSLLGKDIKIREQAEKLVKFLLWADPMVKNAISTQPYAALGWAGVTFLLPLLSSGTKCDLEMLAGFDSIGKIQIYWDICEKNYLSSKHSEKYHDLVEPLVKLYSNILEFQARAICHLSKAQLSRAWSDVTGGDDWSSRTTKIEALSKSCAELIAPLEADEIRKNRDEQLQTMLESRDIFLEIRSIQEAGFSQIQRNHEDTQERELLALLNSSYEDDKDFNPRRVDGTCEWFFRDENFRKWRDCESSTLLWVSAGPGCGKSVLSRTLIDEGRLSTNITTPKTCYFFFKDGIEERMSDTDALRAIIHQIITQDSTGRIIQYAMASYRRCGKDLARNFIELWRTLIQCISSPEAGEINCVIDALDECKRDHRQRLLGSLKELLSKKTYDSSSKIKFLITSRPYDDLEASFRHFPGESYMQFEGDDRGGDIGRDIDLVIDCKIDEIAPFFREKDRQRISEQLKKTESRTYLWLHLIFDIIKQSPSEYSRVRDMNALLSGLPSEISDVYENILGRSKNENHTLALLQIILAAARPLTLEEANMALTLALEQGRFESYDDLESALWPQDVFKSTVKNICGLFISVHDSRLFFIHQTAREFLIHKQSTGKWKGRLQIMECHRILAQLCLSYLPYVPGLRSMFEEGESCPLSDYAVQYWTYHARPVETEQDVIEAVMHFLIAEKDAYEDWASVKYFIEGRIPSSPLFFASSEGLPKTVKLLADGGADLNERFRNTTPLSNASRDGYLDVVRCLVNEGAYIDLSSSDCTALSEAARNGHLEIIQFLLDNGADINLSTSRCTALTDAAAEGRLEIVQFLLNNGADINLATEYCTALTEAARNDHLEIVQFLLNNGADINLATKYCTALSEAARRGNLEIARFLLDNGADINLQFSNRTALSEADWEGNLEVIQFLLDNGADINLQISDSTVLIDAILEGNLDIIQFLLDNGADVNLSTSRRTALTEATWMGNLNVIQSLLDYGADINLATEHCTALTKAALEGNLEIIQFLLDNGADINLSTSRCTALTEATRNYDLEVIQFLLDNGADINLQISDCTALTEAAAGGDLEVVQYLVDCGADVSGRALVRAAERGYHEIVRFLLDEGALEGDDRDQVLEDALRVAQDNGDDDIVAILSGDNPVIEDNPVTE